MVELLQMWALVEVSGVFCLPLTCMVFYNLPDRGWAFSKTLSIVVVAFAVWLPLMCFHALPFSRLFIFGIVLMLLGLSSFGLLCMRSIHATIVEIWSRSRWYILATEIVFAGMLLLLGWLRTFNPDIRRLEAFMDEGIIAGIMRSSHLPPNDVWFAGHTINYYYYAHYIIAMFATLLGQTPAIAFNTGIALFFGLTALNLFGVSCNIVAWGRRLRIEAAHLIQSETASAGQALPVLLPAIPYGLASLMMGLVLGNLAATQQWWQNHGDPTLFNWFLPSRVIQGTINEFPAFSFILSCFHAHVLTLAFTILCVGLAFNLFLTQDRKGLSVFGSGWWAGINLCITALVLGNLFVMNGWDYPTYTGLVCVCIIVQQFLAHQARFSIALLLNCALIIGSLVALSYIFYLPFYLTFVSPSQGIGIVSSSNHSQLSDELLIYGLFAFIFLSFLIVSAVQRSPLRDRLAKQLNLSLLLRSGLAKRVMLLGVVSYLLASLTLLVVVPGSATLIIGGCLAIMGVGLMLYQIHDRAQAFSLLLGATAFAIVAGCEVFFLKDVFVAGPDMRLNTVFKFYFQAWVLLSIACGTGLFFIVEQFRLQKSGPTGIRWIRRSTVGIWSLCLLILVLGSMVYPALAPYMRYARAVGISGQPMAGSSLDGLAYLATCLQPACDFTTVGDYEAIRWLNEHVQGDPVIVEGVGSDYSYSTRISSFTGLPTIMGWIGHEVQWRVNWMTQSQDREADFNRREASVRMIYTSPNPSVVLATMAKYNAQYLYVGAFEQSKYQVGSLKHFESFMRVIYNNDGVMIFQVNQEMKQ
ncbi:MAG: DUF2298 domain-containing protein [Ktedonobacteraceae bacterium]